MSRRDLDLRARRITDEMDAAYIEWLHKDREWIPGAATLAIDAFYAGYIAGLNAASAETRDAVPSRS